MKMKPEFITAPEGLISQGHIGNYDAKIQLFFNMRDVFVSILKHLLQNKFCSLPRMRNIVRPLSYNPRVEHD